MSNLKCLIKQPAGLGDILALQKIVWLYALSGYQVTYPVLPQLLYIKDYIYHPNINYVSVQDSFEHKDLFLQISPQVLHINGTDYIPMEHASMVHPGCVIRAKYKLVDTPWEDWSDYLVFERNKEREDRLYYEVLKLTDSTEYNFVNRLFGTLPGSYTKSEVVPDNNLPVVEVSYLEGYTVFDWCKVLENAANIYTVDTSFLFLIEKLKLRTTNLQLWSRFNTYESIDGLFKTPWNKN